MTGPGTDGAQAPSDAARVAGGAGVVLVANLFNRAARLVGNWYLSGGLGPALYGLYELSRTVVTILASLAPLGADKGVVLFGARYAASGEAARLKGAALQTLWLSAAGGVVFTGLGALGTLLVEDPALRRALWWCLPAVGVWSLLLGVVSWLRAMKDMRGQSVAYLVVLPGLMLLSSVGAVRLGLGLEGVQAGFVLANVVALGMALRAARPTLRRALHTPEATRWEWREYLYFSLPESLSAMLFRVNQWADTLMLGALATAADVGLYRVAVSLAMVGELPAVAVNTMFQPVLAELAYTADPARVRRVVQVVTRWLLVLAVPVYLPVVVAREAVLGVYADAYASTADALAVLMAGQAVYVVCTPAAALIPMSGRARLNLLNALFAAGLNVGLNAAFIPRWGLEGAALATAIALVVWSALRIAEVVWLMGVQPFSGRALGLVGLAVGLTAGARALAAGAGPLEQLGVAALGAGAFLAAALAVREPEDQELLDRVKRRLAKRLGRG